jgi:hypothetical protein
MKGIAGALMLLLSGLISAGAAAVPLREQPCPTLASAATLPVRPGAGVVVGDVAGDGYRGRASIRYAAGARSSCGYFLVVTTRSGTVAVRVPVSYKDTTPRIHSDGSWLSAEPYLEASIQVGSGGRTQFVVARDHGASNVTSTISGLLGDKFRAIPFLRTPYDATTTDVSLYGFATASSDIRCQRGGTLTRMYDQTESLTERRFWQQTFRLTADGFRLVSSRRTVGKAGAIAALENRAGLGHGSFTGCLVAKGAYFH